MSAETEIKPDLEQRVNEFYKMLSEHEIWICKGLVYNNIELCEQWQKDGFPSEGLDEIMNKADFDY